MKELLLLYNRCKESQSNFLIVLIRAIYIKIVYKRFFLLHQNVTVRGIKNIKTSSRFNVGVMDVGFIHKSDKTYLNIIGQMILKGNYYIGRGCRVNVGADGILTIGTGGFINVNTTLIVMNKVTIGNNCVISWNCQLLDDDFHEIKYENKKDVKNEIKIGNDVWIGCGVSIYKGTTIPDGCVIASNSVVRGNFTVPNAIIAGNPAKVIKENVSWS